MIERFEKNREQYREICDYFGVGLEVVKESPFNTEYTKDITEYRFNLSIDNISHSFHIINDNKTVIRCETKAFDQFKFYVLKSNWFKHLLLPKKHFKIKGNWYQWNCTNQEIGNQIVANHICDGFLNMAESMRIKLISSEKGISEIDNYKQSLIVAIDNVPMDYLKLKPSIKSLKSLHDILM